MVVEETRGAHMRAPIRDRITCSQGRMTNISPQLSWARQVGAHARSVLLGWWEDALNLSVNHLYYRKSNAWASLLIMSPSNLSLFGFGS